MDDDGPGILQAQRESMFERGVQLDERRPGAGLGLDIVRSLAVINTYGGSVQAQVSPLGGARLRLSLPAADRGARQGAAAKEWRATMGSPDSRLR